MSDLLNIGSSAVGAYRSALAAIGENVANAETPGFARRSIALREAASGAGASDPVYRETAMFGGVTVGGVNRAWDAFRATEARYAASAHGRAAVREQWLTGIESAIGDGPAGVGAALTRFFNAGTSLASDPSDPLGRSTMLMALEDAVGAFRGAAERLQRVSDGAADSAVLDVAAVNNALKALHDLNGTLRVAGAGTSARAALEDQRDTLIDFVAERIDVAASIAEDGTLTLRLDRASGVDLLNGAGPGLVTMQRALDGRVAFSLSAGGTVMPLPVANGRLSGFLDVTAMVADRRSTLDGLAADFADRINGWSAAGRDESGNPGALLLTGSDAASLAVLTTDPDMIAAASADGQANGNLLALDALRGPGSIEDRWGRFVSANAQALQSAKAEAAAASSWRDNSFAALDEVTGIDLDREAAELLRFQQAYSGATRIIQVARETLQQLLNAL